MPTYSLGPDNWPVDETGRRASYWEIRKELVYYHALANFVRIIGHDAKSLIDVGSAHCHYIQWFDWIPDRVSLDLSYPTKAPGVRSVKANFFDWLPDKKYDVVLCLQVLEHIDEAPRFAEKLRSLGKRLLISVPHNWPAGRVPSHVHDPVTQDKVDSWFGRAPDYAMTVREPFAEERLFCFYALDGKPVGTSWLDTMQRLLNRPLTRMPKMEYDIERLVPSQAS